MELGKNGVSGLIINVDLGMNGVSGILNISVACIH